MKSILRLRCLPGWFFLPCLLAFLGAAWAGRARFAPVPEKPADPPALLVIFHAYDTRGNELTGARLIGPEGKVRRQPVVGSECQLTQPQGTRMELIFEHNGRKRTEAVTWLSPDAYQRWLDTTLPGRLGQLDGGYDKRRWAELVRRIKSRATATKYDYPVVFPVAK